MQAESSCSFTKNCAPGIASFSKVIASARPESSGALPATTDRFQHPGTGHVGSSSPFGSHQPEQNHETLLPWCWIWTGLQVENGYLENWQWYWYWYLVYSILPPLMVGLVPMSMIFLWNPPQEQHWGRNGMLCCASVAYLSCRLPVRSQDQHHQNFINNIIIIIIITICNYIHYVIIISMYTECISMILYATVYSSGERENNSPHFLSALINIKVSSVIRASFVGICFNCTSIPWKHDRPQGVAGVLSTLKKNIAETLITNDNKG